MNNEITPDQAPKEKSASSFLLSDHPVAKEILKPIDRPGSWVNDVKVRRLYLQASSQQWFAPQKIDFAAPVTMDEESKRIWVKFMTIFYTLEKAGLDVIIRMMPRAVSRLKSEEALYYLSVQTFDESRHVFSIENYMRRLGATPNYDWKFHALNRAASMGIYRVENWLFSTLFSENFASCFLRHTKNSTLDKTGQEMCRILLMDESRHLHFLHIVLPELMDRLSLLGKTYVKMSQSFIMNFTERAARALDDDAKHVGLDRRALLEEVFENVEKAYDSFGVTRRFLSFPSISKIAYSH